MFRVIPNIFIQNNVMMIDNGIEMEMIIVLLKFCKKMNKIRTASTSPIHADSTRVLIVSRIETVSSAIISIVISGGKRVFN